MSEFPLQFEQPIWLVLLVLIIPVFLIGRRSIGGLTPGKATAVFALRVLVIVLLAVALARPMWEQRGEGVTVSVVLDRSQSIPLPLKQSSVEILKRATEQDDRKPDDRIAVITVARDAQIVAMPDKHSAVDIGPDVGDRTATNLAEAVRMALAIAPDDTANRILIASDGNETIDSVLQAAEIAEANKIPIDTLLLEYQHDREVVFEQLRSPTRARVGQSVPLTMVLRSQGHSSGTVTLRNNDETIDLNGDEPGAGLPVTLEPGKPRNIRLDIDITDSMPHRFEATFEPDDPTSDRISQNNTAMSVTFVSGPGRVLVIDGGETESNALMQALAESDIQAERKSPEALGGGIVFLSAYDAVILVNTPRWQFSDDHDRMLRSYVHDLGGGLAMLGGPQAFGAGGWIDSELAKALPVKLNPPQTRQMPRGALGLIMHATEMPQGNFWGQKVAESAIKALSRLDYVGIVEFNWGGGGPGPVINGCRWAFGPELLGDKQAALAATRRMVQGDMPDFGSSMQLALNGIQPLPAGQKHVIIISDGDPSAPPMNLINQYKQAGITITTVMISGHGTALHRDIMRGIANDTGGNFYQVRNPKQLPEIFIKEAQVVSRSLIQEGDVYDPRVVSGMPGPAEGHQQVPSIEGYVLTVPREGLAQTPIIVPTSEGDDPVFAHWNYGLGKAIAYTSDITGRWGSRWLSWNNFKSFWEQAVRWVMRPSTPEYLPGAAANLTMDAHLEGDSAVVKVEAVNADASFLNFLETQARIINPDNTSEPLSLQQTGPGQYHGRFEVGEAGFYLVNVMYQSGSGDSAVRGNVQAAVTVPFSEEFRAVSHNAALLRELADRTGGRPLSAGSPEVAQIFERRQLPVPKSPKSIWDLLAIIAAALFVFDVAARRLTIDPKWIASLFARALGRQSERTTDTISAWKRTREQVAEKQTRASEIKNAAKKTRDIKFEASDEDEDKAIDVTSETAGERRAQPQQPKRRAESEKPSEDEEEGPYTSRLLRAKRRARGDDADDESNQSRK